MESILTFSLLWTTKLLGFGLGMLVPLLDLVPSIILPKKENMEVASSFRRETKTLIKQFRFIQVIKLWKQAVEQESRSMIHRKVIFLGVFIVFSVFVLTSTGSVFAVAMIAGFSTMVSLQILPDLQHLSKLRSRFFSDLAPEASDRTVRGLGLAWVILAMLSAWSAIIM